MTINDSGTRRDFGGAVRDMGEGKGRYDLIPLDVLAGITGDGFTGWLAEFEAVPDVGYLYKAIDDFTVSAFGGDKALMIDELAKHFEEGCEKYGERNWQNGDGIPVWSFIDSALRHYYKWKRGITDERHDRAVVWNLVCCIWTANRQQAIEIELPQQIDELILEDVEIDENLIPVEC